VLLDFARRARENVFIASGKLPKNFYDELSHELKSRQKKLKDLEVRVIVWSPHLNRPRIKKEGDGRFTTLYAGGVEEKDRPHFTVVDGKRYQMKSPYAVDRVERLGSMANQNDPESARVLQEYFLLRWEQIESKVYRRKKPDSPRLQAMGIGN